MSEGPVWPPQGSGSLLPSSSLPSLLPPLSFLPPFFFTGMPSRGPAACSPHPLSLAWPSPSRTACWPLKVFAFVPWPGGCRLDCGEGGRSPRQELAVRWGHTCGHGSSHCSCSCPEPFKAVWEGWLHWGDLGELPVGGDAKLALALPHLPLPFISDMPAPQRLLSGCPHPALGHASCPAGHSSPAEGPPGPGHFLGLESPSLTR